MQKSRIRAAILNAANRNAALVIKNAKIVFCSILTLLDLDLTWTCCATWKSTKSA